MRPPPLPIAVASLPSRPLPVGQRLNLPLLIMLLLIMPLLVNAALCGRLVAADDAPVHATWRSTPVASIAERIGSIADMPVVLDRRIDPTRRIDLDGAGRPAETVLRELAEAAGGELAVLRNSFRISPAGLGRRVAGADAARASRLKGMPPRMKQSLESKAACRWEAGTSPAELVERLAEEASIPVGMLEEIPHDHLPAGSLPALPLAERLDLLLAHYDLRIGPAPQGQRGLAIAPLGEAQGGRPRERPADRKDGGKRSGVLIDRYSLRAEAPLGELLEALAKKFGLTLRLDADAVAAKGVAAGEIVRVAEQDAPRERILDAVTKPLGLSWTIEGTTLDVR